jgi:hypothetical protein
MKKSKVVSVGTTFFLVFGIGYAIPATGPQDSRGQSASVGPTATERYPAAEAKSEVSTTDFRPGAGTMILVQLTKGIESKRLRIGDEVSCTVIQDLLYKGKIVVPHKAKVIGHVIEVRASSKDQRQSRLGLQFGEVVLPDKRELPFEHPAIVEAVAAPIRASTVPTSRITDMPIQMEKGRTTGGSAMDAVTANPDLVGANFPVTTGAISVSNRGVIGIRGLALEKKDAEKSVIVGSKGDINLRLGTQLVLRVTDRPQ